MKDVTEAIHVVLEELDVGIYKKVCCHDDGSFTITLNALYDQETIEKAFTHALSQIRNRDFKKSSVEDILTAAHSGIIILPDRSHKAKPPVSKKAEEQARRKLMRQLQERLSPLEIYNRDFKKKAGTKKTETAARSRKSRKSEEQEKKKRMRELQKYQREAAGMPLHDWDEMQFEIHERSVLDPDNEF